MAWADGSCRRNGQNEPIAGYGCVIKSENSDETKEIKGLITYNGQKTNHVAEYKAIYAAADFIQGEYSDNIEVIFYNDSEVTVNQINGGYNIYEDHLKTLRQELYHTLNEFKGWRIEQQSVGNCPQSDRADELAKAATKEGTK